MPFSLVVLATAKSLDDRPWLGWVGMLWSFGGEGELAPFDDAGVAAIAAGRQAEPSDVREERRQQAVEQKGVGSGEARARCQRGMARRRRRRVPVKLRRSG